MRHVRGFSLLEVLVAFTVLALSLGVLMQIFSGSLRNTDLTRSQAQATALAQSLLSSAGIESALAAGKTEGVVADKYRWQLDVAPYDNGPPQTTSDNLHPVVPPVDLWLVTARVAWDAGGTTAERYVTLTTLRVQKPPQP